MEGEEEIPEVPTVYVDPTSREKKIARGENTTITKVTVDGKTYAGKKRRDSGRARTNPEWILSLERGLRDECRLLRQLSHPSIVMAIGLSVDESVDPPKHTLVMELMEGGNLDDYIAKKKGCGGIDEPMQHAVLLDVARGLSYIHAKNIVHWTLSTRKVFLTFQQPYIPVLAKIGGFGAAAVEYRRPHQVMADSESREHTSELTLATYPPEAFSGLITYDPTSVDVFSLGVLILHTLIQECPSPHPSTTFITEVERRKQYLDMLDDEHPLKTTVMECLNNQPHHRPTADDILSTIEKAELRTLIPVAEFYELRQAHERALFRIRSEKERLSSEKDRLSQHLDEYQDEIGELQLRVNRLQEEKAGLERQLSRERGQRQHAALERTLSSPAQMQPTTPLASQFEMQQPTTPVASQFEMQQLPQPTTPVPSQFEMQQLPQPTTPVASQFEIQQLPQPTTPVASQFELQQQPQPTTSVASQSESLCTEVYIPRDEVQIENVIDRGAWATVAKGRYCGCPVAVKWPHDELLKDYPNIVPRLIREIGIVAQLRHPNLVHFIGAVVDTAARQLQERPLLITELLDTNLRREYKRCQTDNKPFGKHILHSLFLDVVYGLHCLHSHNPPIIHRDISAPNVLLKRLPNGCWLAKISDFGSANIADIAQTPGEGAIIYSAPEMFPHSNEAQTTKLDIYSYGVLLCEVIAAEMPARDRYQSMLQMVGDKWNPMHDLIVRCTQTSPTTRPTTAQVIDELNRLPRPPLRVQHST